MYINHKNKLIFNQFCKNLANILLSLTSSSLYSSSGIHYMDFLISKGNIKSSKYNEEDSWYLDLCAIRLASLRESKRRKSPWTLL